MNAGVHGVAAVPVDRIAVRVQQHRLVLPFRDIHWVAARNTRSLIQTGTEAHLVSHPLKWLQERLPGELFARINRSAMVNLAHVREFHPKSHGDGVIVLTDSTELVVSRTRRRQVLAALTRDAAGAAIRG